MMKNTAMRRGGDYGFQGIVLCYGDREVQKYYEGGGIAVPDTADAVQVFKDIGGGSGTAPVPAAGEQVYPDVRRGKIY